MSATQLRDVVVIGASMGGVEALKVLVSGLGVETSLYRARRARGAASPSACRSSASNGRSRVDRRCSYFDPYDLGERPCSERPALLSS